MAKSWKSIKHKFSTQDHARIKQESAAELERTGFPIFPDGEIVPETLAPPAAERSRTARDGKR